MPELIQQQIPDYVGNILKGYQFGQQAKANQLQLLAAEQEMDINKQKFAQAQAENILSETASTGDINALQRLAGLNPTRAEGIRKQQDYNDVQGARVLDSYASMPQYAFSQKKWEQMHDEYKAATGKELPLPFEKSPESILEFKRLSSRLKGREQDLKEQYQSAQIKTEGLEQAKYGVDIQKGKQDLRKGEIELFVAEQERKNMSKLRLTPTAYKSYQQNVGQNLADRNKPLSQESAKVVSLAQGGLDITAQLKDQFFNPKTGDFQKGKFGRAAAGSILPNIMASENAQTFETRRQNLSDLVGRMRSGGAINKDEEKRFLKLIPRYGDGEAVVKYKLNQLNKEFASVQEAMDPYGVRGTDYKKQTLFNSVKDMSNEDIIKSLMGDAE
tara:strand:+ start:1705 stop:2865 length:1161 start_codon:yes stop_codon:yes gene_type:complete